jgi:hypothetical protein
LLEMMNKADTENKYYIGKIAFLPFQPAHRLCVWSGGKETNKI